MIFNPFVKELSEHLIQAASRVNIPIKITETVRTIEEQNSLYAYGRYAPYIEYPIATDLKGGDSYHNYGLAFDVEIGISGKEYDEELLNQIGSIGQAMSLSWDKNNPTHFQYTYNLTIEELKNGAFIPERPNTYIPEEEELTAADFVTESNYNSGTESYSIRTIKDKTDTYININDLERLNMIKIGSNPSDKTTAIETVINPSGRRVEIKGKSENIKVIYVNKDYYSTKDLSAKGILDVNVIDNLNVKINTK